jgi:beta-aspartyl-peptidase (threonine type)
MTPALIIHGGAGAATPPELQVGRRAGLSSAFETGWEILIQDGSALDAVVQATVVLEDHPLFNAGLGSCLTQDGTVEVDAALMDGTTFQAGAVGAVKNVKNAILLAQAVMETERHVFLVGEGAQRFARDQRFPETSSTDLVTQRQRQRWQTQRTKGEPGTVGTVALDRTGRLAVATSTGGVFYKQSGRVGDSAIIGAGTYADSTVGACSATGDGEAIIRATLARSVVELLRGGKDPLLAAQSALDILKRQTPVEARLGEAGLHEVGLIVLDPFGRTGFVYNTEAMSVAFRSDGRLVVQV